MAAITGTSASARVTLNTYTSAGTYVGSNSYTFTVTITSAIASPTLGTVSVVHVPGTVPTAWGVYVQGKSKATIAVSGGTVAAGSSVATYKFTGGGYTWSSSSDTSYTTGFLMTSGTNTFTVTLTDTRGFSVSKSVSVNVEPYEPPSVLTMSTYRALQTGVQSETGAYIIVRMTTSHSSVGGNNTKTMLAAFRRVGSDTWSGNYGLGYDAGWIIPSNIPDTDVMPYQIRFTIQDALTTVVQYYDVAGVQYTMFFPQGGRNVSIGMAGTRVDALEINPAWKIYHGNVEITGSGQGSGVTTIANGGTGSSTAAGALTNLGAAAASHNHATTNITSGVLPVARGGTGVGALTASRALVTNSAGNVAVSAVTDTQLSYLSGATSNIQSQINTLKNASAPKIAYGTTTINGNTAATIYYSGFSSAPFLVGSYSTTGGNWSGDNGAIKFYNVTSTYAYVIVGGSFATGRTIDWIAVGP